MPAGVMRRKCAVPGACAGKRAAIDVSELLRIVACVRPTSTAVAPDSAAPLITPSAPADGSDAGTEVTTGGDVAWAGTATTVGETTSAADRTMTIRRFMRDSTRRCCPR